jgi:hypothetical protein
MKYEITKLRLQTVATKYLLDELGELKPDKIIPNLEIFFKNGYETALLSYSPEMNAYYFSIDKNIFSLIMDTFLLSDKEVGKIIRKLVYDLTGVEVAELSTL